MKVVYTGRHGAVDLPCPDGSEPTVAWGQILDTAEHGDTDDTFAGRLLEQTDNWREAPEATAPKKGAEKAADAAKEGDTA